MGAFYSIFGIYVLLNGSIVDEITRKINNQVSFRYLVTSILFIFEA